MNRTQIICIIIGLAIGFAVSYVSMLLTKRSYQKSDSTAGIMGANSLRLLLDAGTLAAGYAVCSSFGYPLFETLIGIAIGLSVGGMIFLRMMVNRMQKEEEDRKAAAAKKSSEERSE